VDIDVFVSSHNAEWTRLATLAKRRRRLTGPEADELVELYGLAATHLSLVRSTAPDPALVARLSALLARARSAITGSPDPAWREVGQFLSRSLPAAIYNAWRWWVPTAVVSVLLSAVIGAWIAGHPAVQATIAAPEEIRQLTAPGGEYETYYNSAPAASFALRVWTNNVWVAAQSLVFGVFLGLPVLYVLWENTLNLAVGIGLMSSAGRLDVFLGLVMPHGMLELTAVFVAAGIGLRLGLTVIDPGPLPRATAVAAAGRSAMAVAIGMVGVLLISGVIEAFVTPSGLPTWARIGIGAAAETLFLLYVFVLGRRAAATGETGDLDTQYLADTAPTAG
jgi:uncharacterized membrane protein SpoIIM required for sporulation